MNIGQKLRNLRKSKGLTLRELGDELNTNYSHLSKIELGKKNPSIEMIQLLADHFKVPVSYFFNENDTELTKSEKGFLEDTAKLTVSELKEKYTLLFDGREITEEELEGALAWIKANRDIKDKKIDHS